VSREQHPNEGKRRQVPPGGAKEREKFLDQDERRDLLDRCAVMSGGNVEQARGVQSIRNDEGQDEQEARPRSFRFRQIAAGDEPRS
jgi:hypothetical protein